jgi:hypothetical protein
MDEPEKITDEPPRPETDPLEIRACKRLVTAVLFPELYEALCILERFPTPENEARFEEELKKVRSQKGGLR